MTGQLRESNDILEDREARSARFDEDGYLFFRGVLDRELIERLVQPAIDELRQQGLATDDSPPRWTGEPLEKLSEPRLHEVFAYDDVWHAPSTIAFLEDLFNEPVYVFKQTQVRVMAPTFDVYNTPAHQDGSYIAGTDFRTVWIPLRDMTQDVGGLGVLAGSHKDGVREHSAPTEQTSFTQGLRMSGIPLDPDATFDSADFRVGDVVIFHPHLVHRSEPNKSKDLLRFSMDTRVQPARVERGFIATHTAMEVRDETRSKAAWFPGVQPEVERLT